MLSEQIEDKIIKLFLTIAEGEKEIQKLKKIMSNKYNINPIKLFNKIDIDEKGFFTKIDFKSYLNNFHINFTQNDIDIFFFFYDTNNDNYINLEEFIDFLIPNNTLNNQWKNQIKKNKNEYCDYFLQTEILNLFLKIFNEEKILGEHIFTLVNQIKLCDNFSIESLFNVLRGYLYITVESLSAFFDRKNIQYKKKDVQNILNRILRGYSYKIPLKRLEKFFNLIETNIDYNKTINNSYSNYPNQYNNNLYIKTSTLTDNSKYYKTQYNNYNDLTKNLKNKNKNKKYTFSNNEDLINKYLNTENQKDSENAFNKIYECMHLSNYNNSKIPIQRYNKPPFIKEKIYNGTNIPYKNYLQDKRNNSLNHRRNQTIQNNQDFEIKSYFEKHLNSYSNHNYINNNFSNKNVSYEINNCNCNCSQKEYLINPNNYLKNNNNMYKIKKYNQINAPIRITDSLVIKPVIERKKYC